MRTLIAMTFLMTATLSQAGFRDVGNGGGPFEQKLMLAWQNIDNFLKPCLAVKNCGLSPALSNQLQQLVQRHKDEIAQGGLKFVQKWPHPTQSLFHTQAKVGSKIEINMPLLRKNAARHFITTIDAIKILVKALGTHHPQLKEKSISRLARNAGLFWKSRIHGVDLRQHGHPEIDFLTVTESGVQNILLGNGDGYVDLRTNITGKVPCQTGIASKVAFAQSVWQAPVKSGNDSVELSLDSQVSFSCTKSNKTAEFNATAELTWTATVIKGTADEFLLNPSKYSLQLTPKNLTLDIYDIH